MTPPDTERTEESATSSETGLEHLRRKLERVIASDDARLLRLSAAHTSVSFEVSHAPDSRLTILLDRHPPQLADGREPAEIRIELTEAQAVRLAKGALLLPNALIAGEVAFAGPVRKYLAVDPVLRSLLADIGSTA